MVIEKYDVSLYNQNYKRIKKIVEYFQTMTQYLLGILLIIFICYMVIELIEEDSPYAYDILIPVFAILFLITIPFVICFVVYSIQLNRFKHLAPYPFRLELSYDGILTFKTKRDTKALSNIINYYNEDDNYLVIQGTYFKRFIIPTFIENYEHFCNLLDIIINNKELIDKSKVLSKHINNHIDYINQLSSLDYIIVYDEVSPIDTAKIFVDSFTKKEMLLETVEKDGMYYICAYSNIEEIKNIGYPFIKRTNFKSLYEYATSSELKSQLFHDVIQTYGILINRNSDKIYIKPIRSDNDDNTWN